MERKVCFISDAGTCDGVGEGRHLSKGQLPAPAPAIPEEQGIGAFIDRERELCAKTAQSALTVIFKLILGGLVSLILVVVGTVNLQFQGPFVPISLWPVLRIVTTRVLGTVWSSCS